MQVFIAGMVFIIFSWPILTILESTPNGFVFFYLFSGWGLVIVILFLISISHQKLRLGKNAGSNWEA
jgi:Na+/melibiose symporter-like transporter